MINLYCHKRIYVHVYKYLGNILVSQDALYAIYCLVYVLVISFFKERKHLKNDIIVNFYEPPYKNRYFTYEAKANAK